MHWYNNLSIRLKIALPLVLILLVYLASFMLTQRMQTTINEQASYLSKDLLKQITLILEADRDLHQALIAEQSIVYEAATENLLKNHAENIKQARDRTEQALLMQTDGDRILDQFLTALKEWKATSERAINFKRADDTIQAVTVSKTESRNSFDKVRDILDQLTESYWKKSSDLSKQLEAETASANLQQWLLFAVILATIIGVITLLPNAIGAPINAIRLRLQDIATGDGDLRTRLNIQRSDELGELARHFDQFMEKLQDIVVNIKRCTNYLDQSANSVSSETKDTQAIITGQHEAVRVAVAAVAEMTSAIREVASNTAATAERTKDADSIGKSSRDSLQEAVTILQKLSDELTQTAVMIGKLEEQAHNATTVLDVIRSIAEQTNLLALNAAIEAARAGEQGRGFAVVADEVRTLASRTQESTRDIQLTLENLQTEVDRSVKAINASTTTASEAVLTAEKADQGILHIADSISQINQMSLQIAAAAEEQSLVIHGINDNFNKISEQATLANQASENSTAASKQLLQMTKELNTNVNHFKV